MLFSERILLKMNNSSTLSTQFSTVTPRSILGFFCSDCLDLYICGERRSFSKAIPLQIERQDLPLSAKARAEEAIEVPRLARRSRLA